MPFKSFETATIEVGGTASSLIVVYSAPLVRLGIASALRLYAGLGGKTVIHGKSIVDVADAIRDARRGSVLIADVAGWTALERDDTGLRDHVRAERIGIALVACTDESAHRLLQLRGVSGVIGSDCEASELELAVSEISEGNTYFKSENRLAPATGMSKLSNRQVEILELMTRGLLNKQIAWNSA